MHHQGPAFLCENMPAFVFADAVTQQVRKLPRSKDKTLGTAQAERINAGPGQVPETLRGLSTKEVPPQIAVQTGSFYNRGDLPTINFASLRPT